MDSDKEVEKLSWHAKISNSPSFTGKIASSLLLCKTAQRSDEVHCPSHSEKCSEGLHLSVPVLHSTLLSILHD